MKPHPSPCHHVYLDWASSDLVELLVIGPNITMYVLFDLYRSVISDGGDIKVILEGITLQPLYNPCNLFEICLVDLRVGAKVGFNHYRHPKLKQLKQKQQKLNILTLFGQFDLDLTLT